MVKEEMGLEFAGYHPRFIVDQVVATCRFLGQAPELKSPYIDYAINNLGVRRTTRPEAGSGRPSRSTNTVPRLKERTGMY
jgi:hypothetical protein